MHVKPIRSAAPPASPSRLWPAYNLFRCKRSGDLFCAVPEDYPVPTFVDGHGWGFAGKVNELTAAPLGFELTAAPLGFELTAAPLGFERETARVVIPLAGFYLFRAV